VSIWHPGDTEVLDEHLKHRDLDVLMLPVALSVMDTADAVRLANATRAKHIIPCHYGTFDSDLYWCTGDPADLVPGIERPERRYHILGVGEKLVLPAS
jgi:L-ascorbate metabolism protein UlaG (beta-lactamase superfamily)